MWAVFSVILQLEFVMVLLVMNHVSNYPEGSVHYSSTDKKGDCSSCRRIAWKYPPYLTCGNGSTCTLGQRVSSTRS